ncbi:hypothetical protein PAHAL_9G053300 [Panicum hallii]|jgi:hypothetical protein|uniref:Uncharacterized protein n=1 Tax=Panicum hallii TaxID=206008 RepID=A0A2T8I0E9_9POAL|nr:hypothetical protein PAHAL_9G053300 [Panicum hallii]
MGDDFSLCFWNRLVMFRSLFCNVDPVSMSTNAFILNFYAEQYLAPFKHDELSKIP